MDILGDPQSVQMRNATTATTAIIRLPAAMQMGSYFRIICGISGGHLVTWYWLLDRNDTDRNNSCCLWLLIVSSVTLFHLMIKPDLQATYYYCYYYCWVFTVGCLAENRPSATMACHNGSFSFFWSYFSPSGHFIYI